jgi:hypothetical protein
MCVFSTGVRDFLCHRATGNALTRPRKLPVNSANGAIGMNYQLDTFEESIAAVRKKL